MAVKIGVESHLELYTTIFGWHQYGNLWDILTSTGLVFLPFFGILLKNFTEPAQSQQAGNASLTSLRRTEIDFIMMLVVVLLAGQPMMKIDSDELQFTKICVRSGDQFISKSFDLTNDPSLYKTSTFHTTAKDALVPVWWYAVLAFSSGFTHAVKKSLPCVEDMRLYRHQIDTLVINDDRVLGELFEFIQSCYLPTRYFLFNLSDKVPASEFDGSAFDALVAQEPGKTITAKKESEWIGWRPYVNYSGNGQNYFYQGRRAKDQFYQTGNIVKEATCAEQWQGVSGAHVKGAPTVPYEGLYSKLKKLVKKNICERDADHPCLAKLYESDADFNDLERVYEDVIKEVVNTNTTIKEQPSFTDQDTALPNDSLRKKATKLTGWFGAMWNALSHFPLVFSVREAAPVVQALLLMAVYLMLPLGLVFSSYSIQFLVLAAVGVFTLKFLGYIFYMCFWLDQHLVQSLTHAGFKTPHKTHVDFIVSSTYLFMPVLFISLLGWAGMNVGYGLQIAYDRIGGAASPAAQSGSAGGRMVQGWVGGAGRSVTGAGKAGLRNFSNKIGG